MKLAAAAIVVATALSAVISYAAPAAQGPERRVTLTSPEAGAYMTGPVTLSAEIWPPNGASATFFVDGTQVCRVDKPPFACAWNAGIGIKEHQVRLVVRFAEGEQIVRTARTKGEEFAGTAEVQAVQVTVSVMKDGKFVSGLAQSAFRIKEDGKPQTISAFSSEDAPLSLIVAIDLSGSMQDSLEGLKAAVLAFLNAVPANHQVTLLGFNDSVFEIAGGVQDREARRKAIEAVPAWGTTALYDVIVDGIERLEQNPGRKALVVFSDGEDAGSHVTIDEAERRLQTSDVTLYAVGQGRGVVATSLRRILERLAEPTGGRALATTRISELTPAFTTFLEELQHQYLLGYQSTNSRRDGTWREIEVDAGDHGRVRARKGYRALQDR